MPAQADGSNFEENYYTSQLPGDYSPSVTQTVARGGPHSNENGIAKTRVANPDQRRRVTQSQIISQLPFKQENPDIISPYRYAEVHTVPNSATLQPEHFQHSVDGIIYQSHHHPQQQFYTVFTNPSTAIETPHAPYNVPNVNNFYGNGIVGSPAYNIGIDAFAGADRMAILAASATNSSQSQLAMSTNQTWPTSTVHWANDMNRDPGSAARFQPTEQLYGPDVSLHLKLQSLNSLDSLAAQIITSLTRTTVASIVGVEEDREAFNTRRSLFYQTRKSFCKSSPFIEAGDIQMYTPAQQDILRRVNRATFVMSLIESHDIDFFELNRRFLEVFVPPSHTLTDWLGRLFIDLKTQTYISGVVHCGGDAALVTAELFPLSIEQELAARHPDTLSLNNAEVGFVADYHARCNDLKYCFQSGLTHTLPDRYIWKDFLRDFATTMGTNLSYLLGTFPKPMILGEQAKVQQVDENLQQKSAPVAQMTRPAVLERMSSTKSMNQSSKLKFQSPERKTTPLQNPAYNSTNTTSSRSRPSLVRIESDAQSINNATPTPTVLTPAENSKTLGKPSSVSTRQPWTEEEELALLRGLEEVNGPYWSKILSLYGPGGVVSEELKNRSQIQLKDKARNLKLQYLKTGRKVPACLQGVTGELRKRGGAKVRAALATDEGFENMDITPEGGKEDADVPPRIDSANHQTEKKGKKRER